MKVFLFLIMLKKLEVVEQLKNRSYSRSVRFDR